MDRSVSARSHPIPSKAQNRMDRSCGRGGNNKGRGVTTADRESLVTREPIGTGISRINLPYHLRYDIVVWSVAFPSKLGVEQSMNYYDRKVTATRPIDW